MTIDRIVRAAPGSQAPSGHGEISTNQSVSKKETAFSNGDDQAKSRLSRLDALGPDVPPVLRQHGFPDLSSADLRDMTLDGVRLVGANLSGADLRGVNFADATFIGCDFTDADLVDVCCADAVFENCNFSYARFGVTDIAGAVFRHCRFAGGGALTLPWATTHQCDDVVYVCAEGTPLSLDKPPVLLTSDAGSLALLDGRVLYRDEPISVGHILANQLQETLTKLLDAAQQKYIMKI